MNPPPPEWCTGAEAARVLGVSVSTVRREIKRQRTVAGVPVVTINNNPRISRTALLAALPTTRKDTA